jgi:hypothetical protein
MNSAALSTIRIGKREFTVTTRANAREGVQYILTGKRGAKYATCRNVNHTHMMFVCNERGFGITSGFEGVWLSDADGSLKVVSR